MGEAGVPASNFTLSILVKLLGRCRQLDQAFATVDAVSKQYGFQVNVQVYTCLIQACFNNRQPARALALHERMLKEGLKLDEKAYTSLLRGCLQAGSPDQAERIVRHAYGISDGRSGSAPGVEKHTLSEFMAVLGANTPAGSQLASEIAAASSNSAKTTRHSCRTSGPRSQAATPHRCIHGRRL